MITILISKLKLRRNQLIGVTVAVAMVAAGCGTSSAADGTTTTEVDRPGFAIVATTSIWGDVVSQIVGDDASVEILIPIGADSHEYQASPQQVTAILEADLVVANGLGLEESLHDVLESAEADGASIYEVAPDLDPAPFGDGGHDHGDEDHDDEDHDHRDEDHDDHEDHEDHDDHDDHDDHEDHDHGDEDPHVWFDPLRMAQAAHLIAAQLAALDSSVDWSQRAQQYADQLEQTDAEIIGVLEAVADADRKLVTNHDAFGYFAGRYGFEVVGVVIPGGSTLADPSSAEMVALVDEIRHEGVTAIFAETSQPTRLAEAVAAEVGGDVVVVELYSESLGEPGSGAETLIGMLTTNASLIADALSR